MPRMPQLTPLKKRRKPATGKKPASVKKAVASRMEKGKEEQKENKKLSIRKVVGYIKCPLRCNIFLVEVSFIYRQVRLSSKINYMMHWRSKTDEPDEVNVKAKRGGIDSNCSNQIETQQSKGTPSLEVCGYEEENYGDDFEPENANLYSYGNEEEEEYGYREDYEYEEF